MTAVVVVLAIVLVAVIGYAVTLRRRREALEAEVDALDDARERAETAARDAVARAEAADRGRDDALERVHRARRDAADVANRLSAESSSRAALAITLDEVRRDLIERTEELTGTQHELATTRQDLAAARDELGAAMTEAERLGRSLAEVEAGLDDARAELRALHDRAAVTEGSEATWDPGAPVDPGRDAALWDLVLRQVRHTWRTSVAVGPDDHCPLDSSHDPLRDAVEIEVAAAREESGADIDLGWGSDLVVVDPGRAVLSWALVRDLIEELATKTARLSFEVTPAADGVQVAVSAVDDDGGAVEVGVPPFLRTGDGHATVR